MKNQEEQGKYKSKIFICLPNWMKSWVSVPNQIRAIRDLRGITQKQLAEKMEVKQSAIAQVENNSNGDMRISTLQRIASALQCELLVHLHPKERFKNAEDVPETLKETTKGSFSEKKITNDASLPMPDELKAVQAPEKTREEVLSQKRTPQMMPSEIQSQVWEEEPKPGIKSDLRDPGLIREDIKDEAGLRLAEAKNISAVIHKYLDSPAKDEFTFLVSSLIDLHRQMFSQVWAWAGQIRGANLPEIGVPFDRVYSALHSFSADFHMKMIQHRLNRNIFDPIEMSAWIHHQLIRIQPFPGGNVRWVWMLVNIFLKINGQTRIHWPEVQERNQTIWKSTYWNALMTAEKGDLSSLILLHRQLLRLFPQGNSGG